MKREWLIKYRKAKQLTQNEVAKVCGITPQAYNYYELGSRKPRPEKAKILGKLLGFKWTRFYQ